MMTTGKAMRMTWDCSFGCWSMRAQACMIMLAACVPLNCGWAGPPTKTAASGGDNVLWVLPATATHHPQSPEAAEASRNHGRPLPRPEVLQPVLDPALPAYEPRKDVRLSGTFKGASSDVLPHLVSAWAERFRRYYPDVDITIAPPYAGSLGAKELVKETLEFVFVSRELRPEDLTDFRARFGYDPLSVPVCGGTYRHFGFLDAVGFFVHKDNPLEALDFEQLDAIFAQTRHRGGRQITTWGELGIAGEWADKPIRLYGIQPWNGFEEFIRQRVLSVPGKRGEWREDIEFHKTVFAVAQRAAADRYSLGYSGLAYVDAPVKMLPVATRKGGTPVAPTYENVALAEYPLSRLVYFNTNKKPGKSLEPALHEFLKFILSREGQQVVLDQAVFLPLRARQVEASRGMLNY